MNTNTTGVTMAEDRAHTAFPSFTSQFRSAWLLITRKQYLTVPLLTLWIGLGQWGVCLFNIADSLLFPLLCAKPFCLLALSSCPLSFPLTLPPLFMRDSDLLGFYNKQLNCRGLSTAMTKPKRTHNPTL